MTEAVLCFDLVDKKGNIDAPVKRHFLTCGDYKKHRNDTKTMFWSEPMPAELAEIKGKELADRLGLNYAQCNNCHN